jgi:hypothetical protein
METTMLKAYDVTTGWSVEPGSVVTHITTRRQYVFVEPVRAATGHTSGSVEVVGNEFGAFSLGLIVKDV